MRLASTLLLLCLIGLGLQAANDETSALLEARTSHGPNGSAREQTTFSEGLREGHCQRWHPDGTPRAEGRYAAGKKVGEWRFFDESGAIDADRSGVYESDLRVSALGA